MGILSHVDATHESHMDFIRIYSLGSNNNLRENLICTCCVYEHSISYIEKDGAMYMVTHRARTAVAKQ